MIDHAENSRVRAKSERQAQHDSTSKARTLSKGTDTVPEILKQGHFGVASY